MANPISRSGRLENDLAREFGGTFVADNHGCGAGVFASDEFLPEVREEQERLTRNDRLSRFVPIDEVPDYARGAASAAPVAFEGNLEEALGELLQSPGNLLKVYRMAKRFGRRDVLSLLPVVAGKLASEGVLSYQRLKMYVDESGENCLHVLKQFGRGCPVAAAVLAAIAAVTI